MMLRTTVAPADKARHQEPFSRVAPLLEAALLLGAGGGFVLATVLTLTSALDVPLGPWWAALAQAHGHLQLYGWAGLFVLGVAFHFLPRLRGTPLIAPWLVPWILGLQVAGLLLRALSQPLVTTTQAATWRVLLLTSGVLECVALLGAVLLLGLTARRGPPLATRPAFGSVLPFMATACCALGVAGIVNLVNGVQAATTAGVVPYAGDDLNVILGLFGFLVPMALAMSVRSLPMYAGLETFPGRVLWPLAGAYLLGLVLICVGTGSDPGLAGWPGKLAGLGMFLIGGVILAFVGIFLRLMRARGRLPQRVARLAPSPAAAARSYTAQVVKERSGYGPFVAVVASAYLWAVLGGVLLIGDGLALLFDTPPPFALDAIRHSFAIGFIALMICGVAPRMLPGFSGGTIVSPALVHATLWLGNSAAALRVGSLLLSPLLARFTGIGQTLDAAAFGLSGPVGLALAVCLAVNLWPALRYRRPEQEVT
jgi:uncharacterized protein involved in response to NO